MVSLSRKAQKVQDYIKENKIESVVKELPDSTRTAQDAADAVGCTQAQIAKSLVFMDKHEDEPVLVIASGANRVSLKKVTAATGKILVQADGRLIKKRLGFSIGGIPPVGHKKKLFTVLDKDLKQFDTVWAAAGTPNAVFELTPSNLEFLTGGDWIDLSEI